MTASLRASFVPAAALAAFAACGAAQASYTSANYFGTNGLEGLGTFAAFVTFDYTSGSTASLSVSITNTSNAGNGGFLTAIALNGLGDSTVASLLSSSDSNFNWIGPSVTASPFGDFEGGVSISNSWLGGGNPSGGLAVGESATFEFLLSGNASYLATLNANSVLSPTGGIGMVVRFRGFNDGGSDKTPGFSEDTIPAPGVLSAFGLVAALRGGRRRRA